MSVDSWADDRYIARLQEMYYRKSGPSMRSMAEELNAEFGTSFSKNSVIGKCQRIGLTNRCISKERKATVKDRAPRDRTGRIRTSFKPLPETCFYPRQPRESQDVIRLRCVEIVSLNLTFEELGENHCRYIYGDGVPSDFRYCGHDKFTYIRAGLKVTSSYCGGHYDLTSGKGTASERAAEKVAA